MSVNLESLPTVVFAIVMLCWFLFASIFLFRKKRSSAIDQKRDPGLAFSHWLALTAAIAVFFVGTVIRIRSEERLLREALGSEFESYARNVPAIVPGLY